jgi:hypothetical protein
MKTTKRHIETKKRQAAAYNDAVRDILHTDGVFHLIGDERRPDAVWQWDGITWKKLPIEEAHDDLPPPIEHEDGGDPMAAAG